jgi:hypothetical protein
LKEIIEVNLEIIPKFFLEFLDKDQRVPFQIWPPFSHGPMGFIGWPTWWPPIRGIIWEQYPYRFALIFLPSHGRGKRGRVSFLLDGRNGIQKPENL